MLKSFHIFLAFAILLTACSTNNQNKELAEEFVVSIHFDNTHSSWVYLHQIDMKQITVVDSCFINNNQAEFKGKIIFPKRYLITSNIQFGEKILILENDSIHLSILKDDLNTSIVSGSYLNDELLMHQKKIRKIFKKVDALFPDLQRARMANNAEKLSEITTKIKSIEKKALEINFNYAIENPDSFLSPMILNDLSKRDQIDLKRIQTVFDSLSKEVKKSHDSYELKQFFANNYK